MRCNVWRPPGAPGFCVLNTLRTLWSHPLPEFHPLWCRWTTNLPCPMTRRRWLRSPLFGKTFVAVGAYGGRTAPPYFAHPSTRRSRPIAAGFPNRFTGLCRRYGCTGRTFPSRLHQGNSHPVKWGLLRWIKWITPWWCVWKSLPHSRHHPNFHTSRGQTGFGIWKSWSSSFLGGLVAPLCLFVRFVEEIKHLFFDLLNYLSVCFWVLLKSEDQSILTYTRKR